MQWIKAFLLSIIVIFAPAKAMILTTISLIIMDFILGVWASYKRGEPITSGGFKRTVVKLFIYPFSIMLGFLVQQYLTGPDIPVTNIISSMIGMTELLSCLENLNDISGDNILKLILDKLNAAKKNDGPQ